MLFLLGFGCNNLTSDSDNLASQFFHGVLVHHTGQSSLKYGNFHYIGVDCMGDPDIQHHALYEPRAIRHLHESLHDYDDLSDKWQL